MVDDLRHSAHLSLQKHESMTSSHSSWSSLRLAEPVVSKALATIRKCNVDASCPDDKDAFCTTVIVALNVSVTSNVDSVIGELDGAQDSSSVGVLTCVAVSLRVSRICTIIEDHVEVVTSEQTHSCQSTRQLQISYSPESVNVSWHMRHSTVPQLPRSTKSMQSLASTFSAKSSKEMCLHQCPPKMCEIMQQRAHSTILKNGFRKAIAQRYSSAALLIVNVK
eukprot:814892-Amphidinium_carterae.1